jgi:cephalosporin-C deacetylase
MAFFDKSLDELVDYRPVRPEPEDFAGFWASTLAEAREFPIDAVFERFPTPLTGVDVEDVTFSGFAGQRIRGWLIRPAEVTGPLPAIVEYVGYGGGRRLPWEHLLWANAGYAHLVMDTRGQGGGWSVGATPDDAEGSGPAHPGVMTRGIFAPETY